MPDIDTIMPDIHTIAEDLQFLDAWEDRYGYIIDLGRALAPLGEEYKTSEHRIEGCVSQMWIRVELSSDTLRLHLHADSDAMISKGLAAILVAIYNGKRPEDVEANEALEWMQKLGLRRHLTMQRANGLLRMIETIADRAQKLVTLSASS